MKVTLNEMASQQKQMETWEISLTSLNRQKELNMKILRAIKREEEEERWCTVHLGKDWKI